MRALPYAGWHADDFLEDAREVTLLGEPRRERDVGLWPFPSPQHFLRLENPQVHLPPVRRDPGPRGGRPRALRDARLSGPTSATPTSASRRGPCRTTRPGGASPAEPPKFVAPIEAPAYTLSGLLSRTDTEEE